MKRARCCSGSSPSKVPRHRTIAERRGTRKAAKATTLDQSAAIFAVRGGPIVVPGACEVGTPEAFCALSPLSFADQKLPLGRGHLSDEVFEEFPFFDPSGHLLTELRRNVKGSSPPAFLPGEQCCFMDGTFACTTTGGISAAFLANRQGRLKERFDLANAREDAPP